MGRLKFIGENNKYHFIYITTNLINGKKYLGKHSTNNLKDRYIGCGLYEWSTIKSEIGFQGAVFKYGVENFKTEILLYFETSERAFRAEGLLGKILNVRLSEDFYNMKDCGEFGGGHKIFHSIETINKIRKDKIEKYKSGEIIPWNKGTTGLMPEVWNKGTIGIVVAWNKNLKTGVPAWNRGIKMSEESCIKNSENNPKRKVVLQFNLKGEFIKEWSSSQNAEDNGYSAVLICCKHITNSSNNFVWVFKNEFLENNEIISIKLSKLNISNDYLRTLPWNVGKSNVYSKETLELWSSQRKGKPSPNKDKPMKEEQKYKIHLSLTKNKIND
jgi:hypothetical protein